MSRESESQNNLTEYYEEKKLILDRRRLGLELRHKFEIYFVTLIFTLLALAIQTYKKFTVSFVNYLEIIGWCSLLIAGLLGLYSVSRLWLKEVGVAEVEFRRFHGETVKQLGDEVNQLESNIRRSEKFKTAFFILGLLALMASRGLQLICS
jgi:hypothetical protein